MPIITQIIEEHMTHFIHPITQQLTNQLLKNIGLKHFFGDNIYYLSDESKSSTTTDDKHRPKLGTNRCNVTIDPNFNPTETKWDMFTFRNAPAHGLPQSHRGENFAMFHDGQSAIAVYEQLVPTTVSLEFELQIKSKEIAYTTMDALYNRYLNASIVEHNGIVFSYPMPVHIFLALYRLYEQRVFDRSVTFPEYLKLGSDNSISYAASRNGKDKQLLILRNMYKVLSEITFSSPKPDANIAERVPDHFKVTFNYTYQFSRPNMLTIKYPVVVDNKLINQVLVPQTERQHPRDSQVLHINRAEQYYHFARYMDRYPHLMVHFPLYDDWNVPTGTNVDRAGFRPFFVGAFTLDEDPVTHETVTKIDLINDFPEDYKCHQVIIDTMRLQGDATFLIEGLFNISVFANEKKVDNSLLHIDSNLILTVDSTIKYRRYHLVISEATTLKYLNPRYLCILYKYSDFFSMLLIKNLDRLISSGDLYWKKGQIFTGKDTQIRVPYNPTYNGSTDDVDNDLQTGVPHSEIEDLRESQEWYLFTNRGYPILSNQGVGNGINCPWRIGKYIIRSFTK